MVPVGSTVFPGLMAGGLVGLGAMRGDKSSIWVGEACWAWAGSMALMTKDRDRVPWGTTNSFSKDVVPLARMGYSLTTLLKYSLSVMTASWMGTSESLRTSKRSLSRLEPSSFWAESFKVTVSCSFT